MAGVFFDPVYCGLFRLDKGIQHTYFNVEIRMYILVGIMGFEVVMVNCSRHKFLS